MVFFRSKIYKRTADLFYQFGSVYPVLPKELQEVAYVLPVPQIMLPERLGLFCIRNVGRVKNIIYAIANLSKHVGFVNRTLLSVNLSACLQFNQVTHMLGTIAPTT